MKLSLPFIILFCCLIGCTYSQAYAQTREKEYKYPPDFPDLTAEQTINLLMEDKYMERYLPRIKSEDIAVLLKYADDTTQILNFPQNPFSSFLPKSVSRGEVLLWMVEAWRVNAEEKRSMAYFPSGVALLKPFDAYEPPYNRGAKIAKAAKLYRKWWKTYGMDSTKARGINPLQGSDIRW